MAYSTLADLSTDQLVTEAYMDAIKGNFDDLDSRTKSSTASETTSQTTTSTSFTDLATTGPAVTVTTGTQALVIVYGQMANNTGGQGVHMAFAVSGPTTRAAQDLEAAGFTANAVANLYGSFSAATLVTGLNAGNNVFTAKYRAINSGTATFQNRRIIVWPGNKLA